MTVSIVRVYQAGREFIQLISNNDDPVRRFDIFQKTFVHYAPRCFLNGDPSTIRQLVNLGMFNWSSVKGSDLADVINKLDETGEKLEETVQDTLEKCQSILPFDQDIPVWILPGESTAEHLKQTNGLSAAYSTESGGIRVVIFSINDWLGHLPYVLAHEYHHIIYMTKQDIKSTLVNRVVAEGLADDFAGRLFPGKGGPWMSPEFTLTTQEEIGAYKYLHKKQDEEKLRRINGHNLYLQGQLPYTDMTPYTGFAIAYRLVQGYVTSHEVSLSDLLELDPDTILAESIYKPGT